MIQTSFILSLAGLLWFTVGLLLMLAVFGLQRSISDFYYALAAEKKNRGSYFYLWFIITVFLMIIPMIEAGGLWGFLSCIGLAFTGAACAFKSDTVQKWIHYGGALLAAIASVVLLCRSGLIGSYIQPALVAVIAAVGSKTLRPSLVFWLEVVVIYATLPAVMMYFANL